MCKKLWKRTWEREREREMVLAQYWFDGILSTVIGEAWEVNQWKPCTVGDIFQGELENNDIIFFQGNCYAH